MSFRCWKKYVLLNHGKGGWGCGVEGIFHYIRKEISRQELIHLKNGFLYYKDVRHGFLSSKLHISISFSSWKKHIDSNDGIADIVTSLKKVAKCWLHSQSNISAKTYYFEKRFSRL